MAPQISDDVFFADITELSRRLHAKEFSAVELTRAFCDRLERLGARYNALALLLRDAALRKARDADDEIKRGRNRPLQGIPCGVKDLLSVTGQPTTWGARPYAGQVFDEDATAVKKLSGAGAILLGKLAMVELAGGGGYRFASASLTGPGLNPWDRTRWSGGSSSGSGICVSAGLVTFALGSETSGSILTPSAYCGVTGLRPTYGLVSRYGAMALSWTMDKIGPMCRSAEDCGTVLQVISGADSKDPTSRGGFYYAPQFARKMQDIRVGYAPVDVEEWADPACRPDFQKAMGTIRSLGVQMKEVALPDLPYSAMTGTIISAEGASIFESLITSGKVDELADHRQAAGLKAALEIPAKDYLKAMRVRNLVKDAFRQMFVDIDVLVTPTRFSPASKISDPLDATRRTPPQKIGLSGLIPAGNLAGLPALSLPCGFANNLPIAISLVGRAYSENNLLALGREFQNRTDWHKRRPPVSE